MTSKELNKIFYKTRLTKDINLTPEQVEEIIKKLERLELLEKVIDILEPYCYIEWDEVNDAFYFNLDASERIPLSEDYNINRCIIDVNDSEFDVLKEVF